MTTATMTATVTNKNDKLCGPRSDDFKMMDTNVRNWIAKWRSNYRRGGTGNCDK
jgi:hypothetical protein